MTRDDFFRDVEETLRLLARLGAAVENDLAGSVASMRRGRASVSPADLRRYAESIDWSRQDDAQTVGALARVLLRLLAGLGEELESFRTATQRDG